MCFRDEGGDLRGLEAGGGDGGECLLVPEGDPELLGQRLGDHGVPGHRGEYFTKYANGKFLAQ